MTTLTLEQECRLWAFRARVDMLNEQQSKEMLVGLYQQLLVDEANYKQSLKYKWGIDSAPACKLGDRPSNLG